MQLLEKYENFQHFLHTNFKIQVSISDVLHESKHSHTSREIITESTHVIKFLKYLEEVVNFDPFENAINPKLGEKGPDLYFFNKCS